MLKRWQRNDTVTPAVQFTERGFDVTVTMQHRHLCKPGQTLMDASQTVTTAPFSSFRASFYHNSPITLFQYTYRKKRFASLLSHNTQKRGEKQSPRKKSRWEYIIWSEKQLVLAIYCLCVKVIPLCSSVSVGSSYCVGGGHYTTWLQNLHRPLQRPGSLSDWKPQSWRLGQIVFWLRWGDNNTPGFVMRVYILDGVQLRKGGGGTWNLLSINLSAVFIKLIIKQQ